MQPFELDTVLDWADQVLDVLSYLHTRQPQVIHRDIKPRNLKLDAAGRVVLVIGLAKESAASGDVSLLGFTLSYAPLEQIRGLGTEPRSDLYALGATLYELLARNSPADAVQRAAALADGESDPLVPLGELNGNVSPAVAAVITQALALLLEPATTGYGARNADGVARGGRRTGDVDGAGPGSGAVGRAADGDGDLPGNRSARRSDADGFGAP